MLQIHNPPEGYKPKGAAAWCPYCGEEKTFVFDGYLGIVRCQTCGISAEDFYVRRFNGFFAHAEDSRKKTAKDRFEDAVKASGLKWPGKERPDWSDKARDVELPTWEPPDGAKPPDAIHCPECGEYVRHGYYPAVNVKCSRCGAVFSQDKPGGCAKTVKREEGYYCPGCGALLTKTPAEDAAYQCGDCLAWSAPGHTRKAQRVLQEAQAGRLKVERSGPLPNNVLNKVRALAAAACANFEKEICCLGGKPCVFFAGDKHRCRWFEEAVLPLDEPLAAAYKRVYATGADTKGDEVKAAREAEKEARETMKRVRESQQRDCGRCGKPFTPRNNFDRYCSDICRKAAKREANKISHEKKKRDGVDMRKRGIFSSPESLAAVRLMEPENR